MKILYKKLGTAVLTALLLMLLGTELCAAPLHKERLYYKMPDGDVHIFTVRPNKKTSKHNHIVMIDAGDSAEQAIVNIARIKRDAAGGIDFLVLTRMEQLDAALEIMKRFEVRALLVPAALDEEKYLPQIKDTVSRNIKIKTASAGYIYKFGDNSVRVITPSLKNDKSGREGVSVSISFGGMDIVIPARGCRNYTPPAVPLPKADVIRLPYPLSKETEDIYYKFLKEVRPKKILLPVPLDKMTQGYANEIRSLAERYRAEIIDPSKADELNAVVDRRK